MAHMAIIAQSDSKLPIGTNRCLCSGCGQHFGGVYTFELHRTGTYPDRSCLAPSAVSDRHGRPLLRLNNLGYWVRIDTPIQLHKPAAQEAA